MLQYAVHTFHNDGILKQSNKKPFFLKPHGESYEDFRSEEHTSELQSR
jgi:hypothetical protein